MTSRDFCFWLRGYLESAGDTLDTGVIKKKLSEIVSYDLPGSPYWPSYGINTGDTYYKSPTIAGLTTSGG